ncbi:MAG: hypothetical protein ACSW8G_04905, partial [Bacillota bacterium]
NDVPGLDNLVVYEMPEDYQLAEDYTTDELTQKYGLLKLYANEDTDMICIQIVRDPDAEAEAAEEDGDADTVVLLKPAGLDFFISEMGAKTQDCEIISKYGYGRTYIVTDEEYPEQIKAFIPFEDFVVQVDMIGPAGTELSAAQLDQFYGVLETIKPVE